MEKTFIKIGDVYLTHDDHLRVTMTPPGGSSDNPKSKVKQGSITLRFTGDNEAIRLPLTPEQYTAAAAWLTARSEDVLATPAPEPMPATALSQAELAS